jgi:phospho-N-acetylmuramoyl-pentapeptide-transferase
MDAVAFLIGSLAVSLAFTRLYINRLSKTRFLSRESGVEANKKSCIAELHAHKAATPTMGGLVFFVALALASAAMPLVIEGGVPPYNWLLLLFGIMGFIDDYIKIKRVRDGVTRLQKLLGVAVISAAAVGALTLAPEYGGGVGALPGDSRALRVPFAGAPMTIGGAAFFIVALAFMVASSNSMNITDGVDGLASGISAMAFAFIMFYAYSEGNHYVLCSAAAIEGALLGFLWYNRHPAKVFMGDTGSLLLGGAASFYMIVLELPLWLIFTLGVCYFETLSVIVQMTSLKLFNRRVFRIAPFHHHLEKCGWAESRIVFALCSVTLVLIFISFFGGI